MSDYLCSKHLGMEKIYVSTGRQDGIQQIGRKRGQGFYGYGKDGEQEYNWCKTMDYNPTMSEVRQIIIDQINAITDEKILNGFLWNGIRVYLSQENQTNFKSAYDLNVQTNGSMLPMKFKLGEDENGNAVYHTFFGMEEFGEFYMSAVAHVNKCLNDGWQEKDNLDMSPYE